MVSPPKENTIVIEDFPSQAPSVCFMCEACEQGTRFMRTGKLFEAGPFVALSGMKYICENCVRDFAHGFGMFDAAVSKAEAQIEEYALKVVRLEQEIKDLQHVKEAIARLVPETPKPAPKKKATAARE